MKEINSITRLSMIKPELVAPAGDVEKLRLACIYGADAAYLGGGPFSLRASAGLGLEEIAAARALTAQYGKKLYIAANIYADNRDLEALPDFLQALAEIAPDALIVSDPGVIALSRRYAPRLPLHLSTQAGVGNWQAARFWAEQGISRIILARELSLDQAAEIVELGQVETEVFVHGALCVSYSGRCLLSSYLSGRSANRGDCSQSCRWHYTLMEQQRPGEYLPIEEDQRGSYIMNSRDLCLIGRVRELMEGGFTAWKIEGRNKSAYYAANTTRIYRAAIDAYLQDPLNYAEQQSWRQELTKLSHRGYTEGFAMTKPDQQAYRYQDGNYIRSYDFAAILWEADGDMLRLEQRNYFRLEDTLEILLPDGQNISFIVRELFDELSAPLAAANHPRQMLRVRADLPLRLAGPLVCRRAVEGIN